MTLLTLLSVLIIFTSSLPTLGKNIASPAARGEPPAPDEANTLSRNQAPFMQVTGGRVSRDLKPLVDANPPETAPVHGVSHDHVFYDSYNANFSWSDPMLQAALGIRPASLELNGRDDNLVKRSPGSSPSDAAIKASSCMGCLEASNGQVVTLATLDTAYLEKQILLKPDSILLGRCLFYTSVPNPATAFIALSPADLVEYFDRKSLGGADTHPGLSRIATSWACDRNLVTIWVSSSAMDIPPDTRSRDVEMVG